jgi:hypothetical protein
LTANQILTGVGLILALAVGRLSLASVGAGIIRMG